MAYLGLPRVSQGCNQGVPTKLLSHVEAQLGNNLLPNSCGLVAEFISL